MADWKKAAERTKQTMKEHRRKMETDPAYRAKAEAAEEAFSKVWPTMFGKDAEQKTR
jgi:hypothetical protein